MSSGLPGAPSTSSAEPTKAAEADESQESVSLGFGVHVPFGPMLAIGAAIYFFGADRWIAAYFAELNSLM